MLSLRNNKPSAFLIRFLASFLAGLMAWFVAWQNSGKVFALSRALLVFIPVLLMYSSVQAFDNDFEINHIDLDSENFLDIKAHQFRKSLEYQWYDSTNAWRITGASIGPELTFLQTDLKLQHELSEYVNVRLTAEQEVFYADKVFLFPITEVEFYPWAGDLGFSLLGRPSYDKRDMDFGVALIWGRRPWNYTRFEYLEVDSIYSQKNVIDNTFYSKQPVSMKVEGAYQFAGNYKLRFSVSRDQPLEFVDPDDSGNNSGLFNHEASQYFLLFDYMLEADKVIGISVDGFTLDKSSVKMGSIQTGQNQPAQNQQQATDFISLDIYWVQGIGKQYELRVGTQYDKITNDIRDAITSSNDLNYSMDTIQVYATAYHPFNEHMAWDLGLYIGQVEEQKDFFVDNANDVIENNTEIKFRMGFEYSSSDGRNSLQINASLNVDGFFGNIGDGAGISFQSVF